MLRAIVVRSLLVVCVLSAFAAAQKREISWSDQERPIVEKMRTLRKTSDEVRGGVTRALAREVRALAAGENKVMLATNLASLSTEGDFGMETLQEVANTLAGALRETPQPDKDGEPSYSYTALAQLVRYEGVHTDLQVPQYAAAMARLEKADEVRANLDFTLTDLEGKTWSLKALKGKVVVVNFWATWCPPCNKELPDMQALYEQHKDKGLVVLAITDEDRAKIVPFVEKRKLTYPILLDNGRKVNDAFQIDGIPKTFVYDRQGKLVAQAIDMRTRDQFKRMLAKAGVQ
ncbi:MAG TPA: TlpA disulfide reductase family protein [Terriglobales bacterium]|nr:TlpA disulfide reductase family protein [Terriglobales bacterium]